VGLFGGASTPQYQAPPAPPPMAAPPTLASSSVAGNAATRQANAMGAYGETVGTAGGAEGVAPGSVNRAATTLGGTS
jgi:hypothetical protein